MTVTTEQAAMAFRRARRVRRGLFVLAALVMAGIIAVVWASSRVPRVDDDSIRPLLQLRPIADEQVANPTDEFYERTLWFEQSLQEVAAALRAAGWDVFTRQDYLSASSPTVGIDVAGGNYSPEETPLPDDARAERPARTTISVIP